MTTISTRIIVLLFAVLAASMANAELYINEIYFDPPGGTDTLGEYVELRGTPSMDLSDYYLIFLENENTATNTGNPGTIDAMFDLGSYSMGTNGFLTMRQKNTFYTGSLAPAAGTTDLVNTGAGLGWGNGATSSINAWISGGGGVIENSGFTAMLIRNDGGSSYSPELGQDLDQNNDGLDAVGSDENEWRSNWTIVDSIGVFSEAGEAEYGRLYAAINFGPEESANIEPGATYISIGCEIEMIARWGDSTGQTEMDWHATNLTNSTASGYSGGGDFRQSGDPHPVDGVYDPDFYLESSRGVPYGTPLCRTLGETNYYLVPGDTNGDQLVNEDDAAVLDEYWGESVTNRANQGDFNCDGVVDAEDASIMAAHWGDWTGGSESTSSVPEPASWSLLLLGAVAILGRRSKK